KSGRSAMLELLSHDDHFPCCVEDRLITLLLPKFNVELAVRKSVSNDPCFPLLLLSIHDMPTRCRWASLSDRRTYLFCISHLLDSWTGVSSLRPDLLLVSRACAGLPVYSMTFSRTQEGL